MLSHVTHVAFIEVSALRLAFAPCQIQPPSTIFSNFCLPVIVMQQDNQYLIDIFNAAQRITEYTASVSLHSFYEDVQLQDKVVRRLLTIGKTAQRISAATRQDVNGIAWSAIAKMKERLLQDDPVIDADQVWSIAHTEIPQLIEAIRQSVIKDSSSSLIYA